MFATTNPLLVGAPFLLPGLFMLGWGCHFRMAIFKWIGSLLLLAEVVIAVVLFCSNAQRHGSIGLVPGAAMIGYTPPAMMAVDVYGVLMGTIGVIAVCAIIVIAVVASTAIARSKSRGSIYWALLIFFGLALFALMVVGPFFIQRA